MATKIKKSDYPYLTANRLKDLEACYRGDYKTERGFLNFLARKNNEMKDKFEQPSVQRLRIQIRWHKSRTWGNCPTAEYWGVLTNGDTIYGDGISASGWGYDKESTVVADIFNKHCLGMAMRRFKRNKTNQPPYGCKVGDYPYYEGGVGISCYKRIAEWLGGGMEHVSCGRTWDEYLFTFKTK